MIMPMDLDQLKIILQTFSGELEERLQVITQGLLALEKSDKNNDHSQFVEAIFRAAHNIKGTARSLGIESISDIAHHIESLFSQIQKQVKTLTSEDIDLCLEAVDKIRLAMQAFNEKSELGFDLTDLIKRLNNAAATDLKIKKASCKKQQKEFVSNHNSPLSTSSLDLETIRVTTDSINRVNMLLEEMQINHIAVKNQFDHLTKIVAKARHNPSSIAQDIIALHKDMREKMNEMSLLSSSLQNEASMLRLVPASFWLQTLPRTVRDLSHELQKEIELTIQGEETKIDKSVLDKLKDPIIHLIRNAIDHGIEAADIRRSLGKPASGHIDLKIQQEGNEILLTIADDGAGIDSKKIAEIATKKNLISVSDKKHFTQDKLFDLIFLPGFSTKEIITDVSGRGVGLDIVKVNVTELKGQISVTSTQGKGTIFMLRLPLTLVGEHGLLVKSNNQIFAFPCHVIDRILTLKAQDIMTVQGGKVVMVDHHPVPLRALSTLLQLTTKNQKMADPLFIIIIQAEQRKLAILVDDVIKEDDIVIKPLSAPIAHTPCVAGGTLSEKGNVIIVLNPSDLIHFAEETSETDDSIGTDIGLEDENKFKPHILIADDSITTRTLEKNILENKNYRVTIAVDGKEAWELLQKEKFALLITDVVMPNMDGFALTKAIKKSSHLKKLPVIIVTSLGSDIEKKQGIEAGADAYIVKSAFESGTLLELVRQLI